MHVCTCVYMCVCVCMHAHGVEEIGDQVMVIGDVVAVHSYLSESAVISLI